jgi:hypothetical protein
MRESKNYIGLSIGIIFTICSLLLTITYVVPIISVLPGVLVEVVSARLISNEPYSNVSKLTILVLSFLLILVLAYSLRNIWKTAKIGSVSKGRIVAIMSICYFPVHSLGFYCYWAINLNFRGDGQLVFGAVNSFPISSFAFILIGLIIDVVKNKAANTNIAAMQANSYI